MTRSPAVGNGPSLLALSRRWALLCAVDLALHVTNVAPVTLPAPWRPAALVAAVGADRAVVAAAALGHLVLVALGWYLLALATLALLSESASVLVPGLPRLPAGLVLRLCLPGTRRLVGWAIGLGAFAVPVLVASSASALAPPGVAPPPTMTRLGAAAARSGPPPPVPAPPPTGQGATVPAVRGGAGPAGGSGVGAVSADAAPTMTQVAPRPSAVASGAGPAGGAVVGAAAGAGGVTGAGPGGGGAAGADPAGGGAAATGPVAGRRAGAVVGSPAVSPLAAGAGAVVGSPPASAPAAAPASSEVTAPTPSSPGTWVVAPGDHLWSIAERTLTAAWGQAPGLQALGAYWWQVVTANRASLPDPADIDLLFPGDVVALPPVPAPVPAGSGP